MQSSGRNLMLKRERYIHRLYCIAVANLLECYVSGSVSYAISVFFISSPQTG